MRQSVTFVVLVVLWGSFATSLVAQQRPLLTEDPETIGEARTLLEIGMSHVWDQPYSVSGLEGNRISAPLLGLSFGMGRNAEIEFRTTVSVLPIGLMLRFQIWSMCPGK